MPMLVPVCRQRLNVHWNKYVSGTKVHVGASGFGLCGVRPGRAATWRPYSDGTLRPRQNEHLMLGAPSRGEASAKLTNNYDGDALVFREVLDAAVQWAIMTPEARQLRARQLQAWRLAELRKAKLWLLLVVLVGQSTLKPYES